MVGADRKGFFVVRQSIEPRSSETTLIVRRDVAGLRVGATHASPRNLVLIVRRGEAVPRPYKGLEVYCSISMSQKIIHSWVD